MASRPRARARGEVRQRAARRRRRTSGRARRRASSSPTEEEGTTCGQKLVDNKRIVGDRGGRGGDGAQSLYSTIGGNEAGGHRVWPSRRSTARTKTRRRPLRRRHAHPPPVRHLRQGRAARRRPRRWSTRNAPGITEAATGDRRRASRRPASQVKAVGYTQGQTDLIGPLTAAGRADGGLRRPVRRASDCVNHAKGLTAARASPTRRRS